MLPDPSARQARLIEALKLYKPKDIVNLSELALAVGIPDRLMSREVKADPAFPVVEYGALGVNYQFNAVKAIKYMLAACTAKLNARREKLDRLSSLAGIEAAQNTPTEFALIDLRQIDQIQTSAQKRKIQQGEYVLSELVRKILQEYNSICQSEILAIAGRLDAAGQWPAQTRISVEDALRNVPVILHDKLMEWLSEISKSSSD